MALMPGCQEASRLMSDAQDRALPPGERARLRLHLMMCASCRRVELQFEFLRRALRELGRQGPPPE